MSNTERPYKKFMQNLSATQLEYLLWGIKPLKSVIRNIEELLVSNHLRLTEEENYKKRLIKPGVKFNGATIHSAHKLIIQIVTAHQEENNNPETILLPPLTPLYLIDLIYKANSKKFSNFKKNFVINPLLENGYLRLDSFGLLRRTSAAKNELSSLKEALKSFDEIGQGDLPRVKKIMFGHAILFDKFKSKEGVELRKTIKKANKNSFWGTFYNEEDQFYDHGFGLGGEQ